MNLIFNLIRLERTIFIFIEYLKGYIWIWTKNFGLSDVFTGDNGVFIVLSPLAQGRKTG